MRGHRWLYVYPAIFVAWVLFCFLVLGPWIKGGAAAPHVHPPSLADLRYCYTGTTPDGIPTHEVCVIVMDDI
jgi:hypothetical protein